jgi:antitoxin component YwqK of YwqJK toxin-antitoxin module
MFFKKSKNVTETDYFSEIDPNNQLRPKINRADFFRTTEFDFGWLILEPICLVESREEDAELAKRFSRGQKALYFWWYLDGQVNNGGFVQFYYNGYGIYVPAIIKGLEYIGDNEMAELVKGAHKIYLKNKKTIDKARERDLFGGDLYDRLDKLGEYDDKYYKINTQTMLIIEKYAKQHPNEFCVDENGKEFPSSFSGKLTAKFESGNLKEEFELINGVITGIYKTYYESGQLKSLNNFELGVQHGEQKEWFENGNQKSIITIENDKSKKCEYFYENGQLKELSTFIGEIDRKGPWLKFWENGAKQLEAEFKNGEVLFHNYWNDKGEQLLKNGTGLYINEYSIFEGQIERNEQEYKDYKRHGKQWSYTNDILTLYQEMKNGKEHGLTRNYDDEGKLKEETIYENGEEISRKKIDK